MGLAQQEIAAMEGALAEFNKSCLVETHFPLWISCVVAVSIIVNLRWAPLPLPSAISCRLGGEGGRV